MFLLLTQSQVETKVVVGVNLLEERRQGCISGASDVCGDGCRIKEPESMWQKGGISLSEQST